MAGVADESAMQMSENPDRPWFGDEKLFVRFFVRPKLNKSLSDKEGRPIYEDKDYIEIRIPGDKDNINVCPVDALHRQRFRRQYEEWKRTGQGETQAGTPLAEWNLLPRSRVEEWGFFHVRTVEQLAGASDAALQRMGMGAREEQQRAKDWLAAAKDSAHITKMRAEVEEQRKATEAANARAQLLEASIEELKKQMESLAKSKK